MSAFEDMFKGNVASGLAIGVGVAVLAPVIKPLLRPVAKSVLKAGLAAYDQGRVMFAELNEQAGDVLAEARNEMEAEGHTNGSKSTRSAKSAVAGPKASA